MPALSGVERLTLDFEGEMIADEWQDGAVDGTTWRELLAPFIGATELHICRALTWELSSALQLDDVGLDPGLLPNLQELAPDIEEEQAVNVFASFINICQVAGRPVRLSLWPMWCVQLDWSEDNGRLSRLTYDQPSRQNQGSKFRMLVIGRSGVGKSSLINSVFHTTGSPIIYGENNWVRGPTFVRESDLTADWVELGLPMDVSDNGTSPRQPKSVRLPRLGE